jgi:predicted dienelactone hydrolase
MNIFQSAALALILTTPFAQAEPAGVSDLSIHAPHHGRSLTGTLFYPTEGGGSQILYADNPVFEGVPALQDAPMADGTYPLVLMSHGLGGHVRSLGWLSTALAERGAIVVAVNHPNSTWGDFDLRAGLDHWTRAQDLRTALDHLLADPEIGDRIDRTRIIAAGFSYGGWTALSLGGLRGNLEGAAAHCETYGDASSHCGDLQRGGVRWSDMDSAEWDADYSDPRVSAVFAIDPALTWGMRPENAEALVDDVTLVSLGEGANRLLATDFDLAELPAALPEAQIVRITSGAHFSVLPVCKPMGALILEEENDDPVCTDPAGTDRAALHQQIIAAMTAQLGL